MSVGDLNVYKHRAEDHHLGLNTFSGSYHKCEIHTRRGYKAALGDVVARLQNTKLLERS